MKYRERNPICVKVILEKGIKMKNHIQLKYYFSDNLSKEKEQLIIKKIQEWGKIRSLKIDGTPEIRYGSVEIISNFLLPIGLASGSYVLKVVAGEWIKEKYAEMFHGKEPIEKDEIHMLEEINNSSMPSNDIDFELFETLTSLTPQRREGAISRLEINYKDEHSEFKLKTEITLKTRAIAISYIETRK